MSYNLLELVLQFILAVDMGLIPVLNGVNSLNLIIFGGRGETLTSILKQYGASVYSLTAANKSIVDVDNVFEGQHLKIPSARKEVQLVSTFTWSLLNKSFNCLYVSLFIVKVHVKSCKLHSILNSLLLIGSFIIIELLFTKITYFLAHVMCSWFKYAHCQ